MKQRCAVALFLSMGLFANTACVQTPAQQANRPAHVPESYTLVYEQSFDTPESLDDFLFTDPKAWRHLEHDGDGCLELFGKSDYTPKHRSPLNIALIKVGQAGSFVLDVDLKQTGKEYGHRDLCVFFDLQNPDQFYYTHIASEADNNAHQIMIVDDAPRTAITTERTQGVDWGKDTWKHIRLIRDADKGTIAVYFDDMNKPVQTASDKTFTSGYIGFGSFDDVGRIDNIHLWAKSFDKIESNAYLPKR